MKKEDLMCLYECPNGLWLQLGKVEEISKVYQKAKQGLEIDLDNKKWRYIIPGRALQSKDWSKIGEVLKGDKRGKFIYLVFNPAVF